MYVRQYPSRNESSSTSAFRRHRKHCTRHLVSIQGIFLLCVSSLLCFGYWMGQIRDLGKMTPFPQEMASDEFLPLDDLLVSDVVDIQAIEELDSLRTAFYVLCQGQESIGYVQYLSLASVMRFFSPSRLVFLYEADPPRLEPRNWTTQSSLEDILKKCESRYVTLRMKNPSLVCQDPTKMQEFVMKFMLQFGGLYVGRRTFMTEVATFMRRTIVEEHILSYLADDCEGFVYSRQPLSSYETNETATINQTDVPRSLRPAGKSPPPSGQPEVKVKFIVSRQLDCLESNRMTQQLLHTNEGSIRYPCLVIREYVKIDPWSVVNMRSDFGQFLRKAVFNIYNEQETQYLLKATNTSVTPPLC